MKVNSVNGTSQDTCGCGSWLNHWKKFSGQVMLAYCPEYSCLHKDLLGAHVKRAHSGDDRWYIVPLCSEHGRATGTLTISDGCALVSADVKETCGR